MKTRFSIALAVHNGDRYLQALLDSLAEQQMLPCELVVADDVSSDQSIAILENFALDAPFPVMILRNHTRLGVVDNFSKSIKACVGEYIVLADQDDVWLPDKLFCLASVLEDNNALAVFSDADVVDKELKSLGYTMWQRVMFTQEEQDCFENNNGFGVLLKHRVVTGATLAFKADLSKEVLPIPNGWDHDAWIVLVAASKGQVSAVNRPLIAYRQHETNVVGGLHRSVWSQMVVALKIDRAEWYRNELMLWYSLAKRLKLFPSSEDAITLLLEKISHLESRANLPAARWRRIPGVVREFITGRYRRYARNWGSIIFDLLVR